MDERQCTVEGCLKRLRCKGLCDAHYRRWLRHGDPELTAPMGRKRAPSATYNAVHLRLKYDRGEAHLNDCADCGGRAQSWSYDRLDPDQMWDKGRPYSINQDRYQPLCWPCHNARDRAAKKKERAA